MSSRIGLLAGLALVQLALIAIFWLGSGPGGGAQAPLLTVDGAAVTRLEISGAEETVAVDRTGAGWEVDGYVALGSKVDEVLDKLAALDAPWPVATSADSARRFEVDEDNFQRRVRLLAGDDVLGELYLGTSPGYQRVHARRADDDAVFSVALSNFEFPVNRDGWLDKTILAVDDEPSRVAVEFTDAAARVLEKTAEGWLVDGAAADQDATATYVNRFKTLRVLGAADEDAAADKTVLAKVSLENGASVHALEIARLGEEGDYLLREAAAAAPGDWFRVSTYIAEQLLMQDVELAAASVEAPALDLETSEAPGGDEPHSS